LDPTPSLWSAHWPLCQVINGQILFECRREVPGAATSIGRLHYIEGNLARRLDRESAERFVCKLRDSESCHARASVCIGTSALDQATSQDSQGYCIRQEADSKVAQKVWSCDCRPVAMRSTSIKSVSVSVTRSVTHSQFKQFSASAVSQSVSQLVS